MGKDFSEAMIALAGANFAAGDFRYPLPHLSYLISFSQPKRAGSSEIKEHSATCDRF